MRPVLTKRNQHLFTKTLADKRGFLPAQRLGSQAGDFVLDGLNNKHNPWFETEEEVEEGLAYGAEKDEKIAQVRELMETILSVDERVTMELRFVHDLSYREIGRIMDRNASTIFRRVNRSLKKIRRRLGTEAE
jgi:RNA polymerase sigma factor (sigma-70 family)